MITPRHIHEASIKHQEERVIKPENMFMHPNVLGDLERALMEDVSGSPGSYRMSAEIRKEMYEYREFIMMGIKLIADERCPKDHIYMVRDDALERYHTGPTTISSPDRTFHQPIFPDTSLDLPSPYDVTINRTPIPQGHSVWTAYGPERWEQAKDFIMPFKIIPCPTEIEEAKAKMLLRCSEVGSSYEKIMETNNKIEEKKSFKDLLADIE